MARTPRPRSGKFLVAFGDHEFWFASAEEAKRLGEPCRQIFCWLKELGDEDVSHALAIARVTAKQANPRGRPREDDRHRFEKMSQLIGAAKNRGEVLKHSAAAELVAAEDWTQSPGATAQRLRKNYAAFLMRYGHHPCRPHHDDIFFGLTTAAAEEDEHG